MARTAFRRSLPVHHHGQQVTSVPLSNAGLRIIRLMLAYPPDDQVPLKRAIKNNPNTYLAALNQFSSPGADR
jgi:hypothetical protein